MSRFLRVTVLLTAALLPPTAVLGQEVRLGLTGGVASATLAGTSSDLDRRTGLVLGATLGRGLTRHVSVETGLVWMETGARGLVLGFEEALQVDHVLSYLTIPLLLRAHPLTSGPVRPTVVAGPALGFEVGCDSDVDVGLRYLSVVPCGPGEVRSGVAWAWIAGAGVEVRRERLSLLLEGRYHAGLSDLAPSFSALEVHSRAFTVQAGVTVPVR